MPSLALAKTSNKDRAAKPKILWASVGKVATWTTGSSSEFISLEGMGMVMVTKINSTF
jgi:hypothetical protein